MAGKYQHYLQKMLQRGFRSECSGKRPSVFVYEHAVAPYRKRAEDFGGEDEFYSPVSDGRSGTLDDKITQWEARRQADVRRWRSLSNGHVVSAKEAAEVVGLTGVRTRAIRDTFRSLFEDLFPKFASVLQDPDVLMTRIDERIDLNFVYDTVLAQQNGLSPDEIAQTYVVPEHRAARRMLDYTMSEVLGHQLSKVLRELNREIALAIDENSFDASKLHVEAIEKLIDEGLAREDLVSLDWSIVENRSDTPWILPDCAVVALKRNGKFSPFLFGSSDETQAMLLPLSPNRMLVGANGEIEDGALSDFTVEAAACSRDWFIAHELRDDLDSLRSRIGSCAAVELSDGMETALSAVDPLRTHKETAEIAPVDQWSVSAHGMEINEEELRALALPLCRKLSSASSGFDLSRLNQVVICSDVPFAMASLDSKQVAEYEGDDNRRIMNWVECGNGRLSYALCIHVLAVEAVCDKDHESNGPTVRHLLQVLAHIHARAILASVAPDLKDMLEEFTSDDLGPWARDVVMHSALTFMDVTYGCRIEDVDDFVEDRITTQLLNALEALTGAPLPNKTSSEENNAAAEELGHAAAEAMIATCRYLTLSQEEAFDPLEGGVGGRQVRSAIAKLGLEEWLSRLDFELQRLRVNFSSPLDPDRVIALQRHFERLFWAKRTVLTRYKSDQAWIAPFPDEAPGFEDIAGNLRTGIMELLPDNLSEQARLAMGLN